jgi:hypothetical protein
LALRVDVDPDYCIFNRSAASLPERCLSSVSLDGIVIPMPMFYFRFEARPKNTSEHAGKADGAFVNCWIQRDTPEEAESYARGAIADQDWSITGLEDSRSVTRDTQPSDSLHYFEQAELDGEVFVFHTWGDGTSTV